METTLNATSAGATTRIERWFAQRALWQRCGLAFLLGAVATLGHAPFQIAPR